MDPVPPPPPSTQVPAQVPVPEEKRRRNGLLLWIGVAALLAAGLIVFFVTRGGDKSVTDTSSAPTLAADTTVAPTSTAASTSSSVQATTTVASTTPTVVSGRGVDGVVDLVAFNGGNVASGIPGPAPEASAAGVNGLAVASNGDVFVAGASRQILKISGGQVSVLNELPDTENAAHGIALAGDGTLFISTSAGIRSIKDGVSTVVVDRTSAGLSGSLGPLALDATGNLFIADNGAYKIFRRAPDGTLTVYAGAGTQAANREAVVNGGPATSAKLGVVAALATDTAGNLLVADGVLKQILRITPAGVLTSISGAGSTNLVISSQQYAPDGTQAADLLLGSVDGLAIDAQDRAYVSDGQNHVIVAFKVGGAMSVVAADQRGGSALDGLPAKQTRVTSVSALTFDSGGNLFFVDSHRIRRIAGVGTH